MPALSSNRERGATVMIFTLLLSFALLPILGLCVDVSFVYFANSRFHAAADAAALAGGRSLSVGLDFASQKANAESIANQYFAANFPTNFLGAQNIKVTATAQQTGDLYRTVTVTASADIPLSFMRMVGYNTAGITASAQTSRRDINIVLVLDRSGSMQKACGTMKSVARSFVDGFTNGRDTMGLVSFVATANVDFASNQSFKGANLLDASPGTNDIINKIACNGSTNSSEALITGLQTLQAGAQPGAFNVLVFFTDGYPHGFTAIVQKKSTSTCADPANPPKAGFVRASFNSTNVYVPGGVAINKGDPAYLTLGGCTVNTLTAAKAQFNGFPVADSDPNDYDTDAYGNATDLYPNATINNNGALSTYTLKTNALGLIDINAGNAWLISKSTAYDAARKIRAAGVTLYTIGLDGNGGVDNQLLLEMANDRNSDQFDATQPIGKYAYASDAGQLSTAFNSIKSELLRLAQ